MLPGAARAARTQARQNRLAGLVLGGFVVGVAVYSVYAVGQSGIDKEELEDFKRERVRPARPVRPAPYYAVCR